jgi:hypothetical protein
MSHTAFVSHWPVLVYFVKKCNSPLNFARTRIYVQSLKTMTLTEVAIGDLLLSTHAQCSRSESGQAGQWLELYRSAARLEMSLNCVHAGTSHMRSFGRLKQDGLPVRPTVVTRR